MKIIERGFLNVNTRSCHAATMAFYKNEPVFSWFGGSREGDADCSIYIQYNNKVLALSSDGMPKWNPILFSYDDKLFLFLKSGVFCDRWQTFIINVSNIIENNKISDVSMLPAGLNGPVKTKPIVKNGLIHCGSSVETIYDWTSYIETYLYDKDSGSLIFVKRSNPLTVPKKTYKDANGSNRVSLGIIQPSLWKDKSGNMNAFFRSSRGLGSIYYSYSKDDGNELWSSPSPTRFDNPNSGIDTVYMDNNLFLVYNPSKEVRAPLIVSRIEDQLFETMDSVTVEESIPEKELVNSSELSYPYMVGRDGKLHLVYTRGRSKIEYVVINT